jgi:hypothetical protein
VSINNDSSINRSITTSIVSNTRRRGPRKADARRVRDQLLTHAHEYFYRSLHVGDTYPRKQHQHDENAYQRARYNAERAVDAAGGSARSWRWAWLALPVPWWILAARMWVPIPGRSQDLEPLFVISKVSDDCLPASAITVTGSDSNRSPYCQPVATPVQYGTMRAWFGAPPAGFDGT